jgi:hypothetical protein
MQRIRSNLSFANVISVIALFVALGGANYAAVTLPKNSVGAKQIKKNGVGASEIKKNAVRAAEIKSNAVSASEIKSNAVGTADIADNGVGGADLADNSVGGSEVTNDSLNADDILGASLEGEIEPDVIARVQPDGTLLPREPADNAAFQEQSKGIAQANVTKPALGTYCIAGLPKQPRSAVVTSDNAGASGAGANAVVVSVAVERGNNLGGCPAGTQARVVATNVDPAIAAAANIDKGFILWMEY